MEHIKEALASLCHDQWSGWMKYLFSKCEPARCEHGTTNDVVIPAGLVSRWRRQCSTPYSQLPDIEKESDRAEAQRIIETLARFDTAGFIGCKHEHHTEVTTLPGKTVCSTCNRVLRRYGGTARVNGGNDLETETMRTISTCRCCKCTKPKHERMPEIPNCYVCEQCRELETPNTVLGVGSGESEAPSFRKLEAKDVPAPTVLGVKAHPLPWLITNTVDGGEVVVDANYRPVPLRFVVETLNLVKTVLDHFTYR